MAVKYIDSKVSRWRYQRGCIRPFVERSCSTNELVPILRAARFARGDLHP